MSIVCLARQPIVDRDNALFAYELRYRDAQAEPAENLCQVQSAHALFAAFSHIGEDRVAGPFPPFVNLSYSMLLLDSITEVLPANAIVEVEKGCVFDDQLLKTLTHIKDAGFSIALDDFVERPEMDCFIRLADIIKLDVLALSGQRLVEHVDVLRQYDVKLLAEKVETAQMYEICKDLGFDYFQGFYLGRPELLTKARTIH